jgi:phage terminase large subunit GpA-like protein
VLTVKRRSIELLRPPPPLKVSEWAKKHRSLSRKDSARPGRWRSEPHQDETMDACCDPRVRKVVVMAASQVVGKSQMLNNVIGRFIDVDPSNMLVMHPTIAAAEKWSIGRLDPLITETKRLHDKIQPRKSRSIGDRILHRQFRGGQMFIVGSNAPADLAAQSVRIVIADEVDRYEASAGEEGDPLELAEQRTETYPDALVLETSTPLIEGLSRIAADYEDSERRIGQLNRPHCRERFAPEDRHLVVPERADGSKDFGAAHTCSRLSCRSARISWPRSRCTLGRPFLRRVTW